MMKHSSESETSDIVHNILSMHILQTQREIETTLSNGSCNPLANICKYVIEAGGKRLRPLLTLLACEAVRGDFSKALPISVATELAHTLSIIQDDIFDEATLRRGVKPVHMVWGTPTAILASDYLFLKMIESILRLASSDVNSQKLALDILHIVVEAGLESVEGEYLDLQLSEKEEATVEECILVAEKKTGALIKAALESGAMIGGGSREQIDSLKSYGEKIGIAYQITDDLLGLTGSQSYLRKDIGVDIINKKMTVVIAHALQNSSSREKEKILEVFKNKRMQQKDPVVNLLEIFKGTGSLQFAQKLAVGYAEKAVTDLRPLEPTQAKGILERIPTIIIHRNG